MDKKKEICTGSVGALIAVGLYALGFKYPVVHTMLASVFTFLACMMIGFSVNDVIQNPSRGE